MPVTSADPTDHVRVTLRPLGSPLPLGVVALLAASLLLSALELRWIPVGQSHVIALAVLVFVVPLQALGCVFGLLTRDSVAASGLGVLAGTWAATATTLLMSHPGGTSSGLGVLLVTAAGIMLVPAAVAATGVVVAAVVFLAAGVRFAVSGVYELTGAPVWQHAAGIAGLVIAGIAAYAAVALELEAAVGRAVLPVLRHHQGRRAMSGRLSDQVVGVARAPGVRGQL